MYPPHSTHAHTHNLLDAAFQTAVISQKRPLELLF